MRVIDVETVLKGRRRRDGVVAALIAASLTIAACGGTGASTDQPTATVGHSPSVGQPSAVDERAVPATPPASIDPGAASPGAAPATPLPVTSDPDGTGLVEVNVRDLGAAGDGRSDDTEAIQGANDSVASRGGGRVLIPRGTYLVRTITQDSEVEIRGEEGATLRQIDGHATEGLVVNRVGRTRGSVERGSGVLTVRDADGIQPGVPLAIADAGSAVALPGLGGSHGVHYSHAVRTTGNQVWLDRPAPNAFRDAHVYIGTVRTGLVGLTLDDARPPSHSANSVTVRYALARWARITDSRIKGGAHGAISLERGSRESVVERNVLLDNGRPSDRLGAAVWLFRGSSQNVVQDNLIGGESFIGVAIDDRTSRETVWDAPSDGNLIRRNVIDIPHRESRNAGVVIEGSSHNQVVGNTIRGSHYGVRVLVDSGRNALPAHGNRVEGNELVSQQLGIQVTGRHNTFVGNRAVGVLEFIRDGGEGNHFSDNS